MKLLPDTHILVWALADDPRLSKVAREAIIDPHNVIYFSSVSVWEVALKHGKRPESLSTTGVEFEALCKDAGYLELPLAARHVSALERLGYPNASAPHHDPFDHILMAQALSEGMKFVTHDPIIQRYKESFIWHV